MSFFKFPSIANGDKYGYMFSSESNRNFRYPEVSAYMLFFETYGHTNGYEGVQHSPEGPILAQFASDYFASMAQHLLAHPEDVEKGCIYLPYQSENSAKQIAFAATVVYKQPAEGKYEKPRYYSLEEFKITSNENKRYDKRYSRIESWADGTFESIMRILSKDYDSALEIFARAHVVRDWCSDSNTLEKRPWGGSVPKLGKDTTTDESYKQESGWDLLCSVMNHIRGMDFCKRRLASWHENLEYQRQRAEEKKDENNAA